MSGNTLTFSQLGESSNIPDGVIDEFAIKNGYGATQTDINNIYNGGAGANFESVIASADVYYHLDESGIASTAVDSSSSGNNGALNNFTLPGAWVAH
jgi:hypothetical protein